MSFGSYANTMPPGAPTCWGEGFDPEDETCDMQCGFAGSCRVRFRKAYGRDDLVNDYSGGRVSVVRRSGTSSNKTSASRAVGRTFNGQSYDGHDMFSEEEQEGIPLLNKLAHNIKVGIARSVLDDTYDLFLRRLLRIRKF